MLIGEVTSLTLIFVFNALGLGYGIFNYFALSAADSRRGKKQDIESIRREEEEDLTEMENLNQEYDGENFISEEQERAVDIICQHIRKGTEIIFRSILISFGIMAGVVLVFIFLCCEQNYWTFYKSTSFIIGGVSAMGIAYLGLRVYQMASQKVLYASQLINKIDLEFTNHLN